VSNQRSFGTNLALKHRVAASSQWLDFADSNAVDGGLSTEWMSDWADTQWIYVDLGSRRAVDIVVLRWGGNWATSYGIQVANDTGAGNWREVYSTTTDTAGGRAICGFTPTLARYVRLATNNRVSIGGVALGEFQVYCTTSTPVAVSLKSTNAPQPVLHQGCFKVSGSMFTLPGDLSGFVSLYDLRGKLLRRGFVSGRIVDLHKDFGLSKGQYLIRVK
jgi:chondroitin AC lyase